MKPRRIPHVLDKKRTGKFSEGSKGPLASDIVSRIWITLYHLARKKDGDVTRGTPHRVEHLLQRLLRQAHAQQRAQRQIS
jgi:hypothetical protein